MSEPEPEEEEIPQKPSKLPLIMGLVLALIGGGGGFYATWSGMILGSESAEHVEEDVEPEAVPDVTFVPVDPMVVSLNGSSRSKHLKFRAQLEVPTNFQPDVEKLLPRVIDVLNGYLRALEVADLEDPSALTRLRSQMLRRVQIVTGQGRDNDLLIMEFVLN